MRNRSLIFLITALVSISMEVNVFASTITAVNESNVIVKNVQEENILDDAFNQELLKYATQEQIDFYKGIYYEKFGNSGIITRESVYLTYDEYFSSVSWISRDGVVSLSIYPKSTLTNVGVANILMARAFHSFSLLEDRFGSDIRWRNTDSLSAQYHCHVLAAGALKTPWNIEPHRTESGLWQVIAGACNP